MRGVVAVGLEDTHRSRGADAMAVQEHHDAANRFLFCPTRRNLPSAELADARHLLQLTGVRLDDFEGVEPELADDTLRELRPDTPDHA
jgi:hypothetical protein